MSYPGLIHKRELRFRGKASRRELWSGMNMCAGLDFGGGAGCGSHRREVSRRSSEVVSLPQQIHLSFSHSRC